MWYNNLIGRAKNDKKYHIYAITNYNKKGAVEVLKNTSSRPVGNAIKDGSFDIIIRNNEENVNAFDKNSLNIDVKHSRRVVAKEGISRSIDDAVEMLAVVGNLEDETHDIELSKGKLIDGFIAQINNEAVKGRLNANSTIHNYCCDFCKEFQKKEKFGCVVK